MKQVHEDYDDRHPMTLTVMMLTDIDCGNDDDGNDNDGNDDEF